jgi:hypothetical protein
MAVAMSWSRLEKLVTLRNNGVRHGSQLCVLAGYSVAPDEAKGEATNCEQFYAKGCTGN